LALSLADGLGPVRVRRVAEQLGEEASKATPAALREVDGIGPQLAARAAASLPRAREEAKRQLHDARRLGLRVLCRDSDDWPPLLLSATDAPPVLWVWGNLEPRDLHAVAIVGSRRPSQYGIEQASRFGALLAGMGATVVSGGAYGVDARAHRGALTAVHGRTIAVLGSGCDVAYPPENAPLLAEIAEGRGAVVSELRPGTPPHRDHFPRRNRIISGMSRAVLVIEAAERSGALITARVANEEHGRPVFALPGRVDNPLSFGPHALLRDGARIATTPEDVLENLGPMPADVHEADAAEPPSEEESPPAPVAAEVRDSPRPPVEGDEAAVLHALRDGVLGPDAIIDATGLPASKVTSLLTLMSLRKLIRREGSGYRAI
jgi:DNA processing protein